MTRRRPWKRKRGSSSLMGGLVALVLDPMEPHGGPSLHLLHASRSSSLGLGQALLDFLRVLGSLTTLAAPRFLRRSWAVVVPLFRPCIAVSLHGVCGALDNPESFRLITVDGRRSREIIYIRG